MNERKKTLSKLTIIFMVFATVFALRNIINNQVQFGLLSMLLFLVGGIVYAIPIVFISSEFASIKKLKNAEAGLGSYCSLILGKKCGFLASWSSFFTNLFYFATLAPFTVIAISFVITGTNGFDLLALKLNENGMDEDNASRVSAILLACIAIVIFWIGSFIAKKGARWIGIITNIGGTASLMLGVVFIVLCLFVALPVFKNGQVPSSFDKEHLNPMSSWGFDGDWWGFMSAFPWIMISYNGIETMAVFMRDTKKGPKAFKISTLIGMLIVIFLMVCGGLALSLVIEQGLITKWGLSNTYYYVFSYMFNLPFDSIGGTIIIRVVALVTALNGLGALFFWTVGPVKVFFSEIPEGVMGKWAQKTNKAGIPTNGIIAQAIVVTIILLIVGVTTTGAIGKGSSNFLTLITQTTTTMSVFPFLFFFISYIKLRWKLEDTERTTKFFKNKYIAITITSISLMVIIIAIIFGAIPSPVSWKSDWVTSLTSLLLSVGGLVIFMGFAMLMWYLNVQRKNKKLSLNNTEINEIMTSNITKEEKVKENKKTKSI